MLKIIALRLFPLASLADTENQAPPECIQFLRILSSQTELPISYQTKDGSCRILLIGYKLPFIASLFYPEVRQSTAFQQL